MEDFMSRFSSISAGVCVLLAACEMPATEHELMAPPVQLATLSEPDITRHARIDHGDLPVGGTLNAVMSKNASLHIVHFSLTQPAQIELRIQKTSGAEMAGAALALFPDRRHARSIARGSSTLRVQLGAGSYRVEVRGLSRASYGEFQLTSSCSGAGCPAPGTGCLFGEQFADIRSNPQLELSPDEWITSADQLADAVEEQQLVLAVQQSSHTDVMTPEEALERVDQNEVRRIWIRHATSDRAFVAYEYGAGDNSYGAFFEQQSLEVAASIHDGDLLDCAVTE
jgi:hypothetical protein